jgi:hypothetical protein
MTWIMVDIEADGPIPGDYSMIALGAVIVEPGLERTFKGLLRPVSERWVPEALAVSGFSREQTEAFEDPKAVMEWFEAWLAVEAGVAGGSRGGGARGGRGGRGRPMSISDNNGFDWQFVNWYFHHFLGRNPFGHSSTNLGSLYKGLEGDMRASFRGLRRTRHTHDPVDDARGNAEALLHMKEKMGLKIRLGEA